MLLFQPLTQEIVIDLVSDITFFVALRLPPSFGNTSKKIFVSLITISMSLYQF